MRSEKLDLASDPIPVLIRRIAVPAGLGMFFNTMYNVVDTWFGGRISTTALAAMSLSFPIFFILLSFSAGFSTGVTAVVGNTLGRRDERRARELVLHALLFGVFLSACVSAVGLLAAPSLFRLLGAREEYLAAALSYVRTIFMGSVFFIFSAFFNAVLTATGNTRPYRNFLAAGFLANIVLDPWFIYGGWGMPAMGLRGVAVATVVIQAAGCAYLFREVRKTGLISRIPEKFRFRGGHIGEILAQGLPASVNYLTIAAGIFVITYFVGSFGREAVAAYGAAVRIEQIVLLPAIGLNTAVLALSAQNAGARRFDRIRETRKWALIYGGLMMAGGFLLVFFLGGGLLRFFSPDKAVIAAGTAYLRIDAFALYAYVILFTHVGILQGLKKPAFPVIIGVYRQIAAPAGIFYLFTRILGLGLTGIWWGILVVTWSAALMSFFLGDRILRKAEKQNETP